MKFNKPESGRSMVEMLGTLAIIGVLSIGGIMGYSYAVDKYRANETINDINLRFVDLHAQSNNGTNFSLSGWPSKTTAGYDIVLPRRHASDQTIAGVKIYSIPKNECEIIGETMSNNQYLVKLGYLDQDFIKGECSDENHMIFLHPDIIQSSYCKNFDSSRMTIAEITNETTICTCKKPYYGTNCNEVCEGTWIQDFDDGEINCVTDPEKPVLPF